MELPWNQNKANHPNTFSRFWLYCKNGVIQFIKESLLCLSVLEKNTIDLFKAQETTHFGLYCTLLQFGAMIACQICFMFAILLPTHAPMRWFWSSFSMNTLPGHYNSKQNLALQPVLNKRCMFAQHILVNRLISIVTRSHNYKVYGSEIIAEFLAG